MQEIALIKPIKNPSKILKKLFEERSDRKQEEKDFEDIFYEPSRLLNILGYNGILEKEPFKFIRTAGSVWEFYILQLLNYFSKRDYNYLIKRINRWDFPIKDQRRAKLGNPFNKWQENYQLIENFDLKRDALPFAKKLISRALPLRQNGTHDFLLKRKRAAKAFFNYLVCDTITKYLYNDLSGCENSDNRLALLIKKYPDNELFIVSGLMSCLYGGKNKNWVDTSLAKAVLSSKNFSDRNYDIYSQVYRMINCHSRKFKPPYKDIYDPKHGNRERVNINFRIHTWLKLMEDTLVASK